MIYSTTLLVHGETSQTENGVLRQRMTKTSKHKPAARCNNYAKDATCYHIESRDGSSAAAAAAVSNNNIQTARVR